MGPAHARQADRLAARGDRRLRLRAGDAPERAAGAFRLHGDRHRRRSDPARQPRGLPEVPAPAAPPGRCRHARPAHGAVRPDLSQPDRAGADGVQPRLPRGRRARRRARRPQGRSPADAVDRRHHLDRGGDRGARPAGVVPALSDQQVGSGRGPGAARREGRRRKPSWSPSTCWRGRTGRRCCGCGAPTRATAALPRAQLQASSSASPTSTASTSPASPAPAPPTSPGNSSSACATR